MSSGASTNGFGIEKVVVDYCGVARVSSSGTMVRPADRPLHLQWTGVVRAHRVLVPACLSVPRTSCWLFHLQCAIRGDKSCYLV